MVRWPFQGNSLQCNHLVKFNGHSVEISGLSLQGFDLGKLGMKPELMQTVSHALMLIDASQYYFCEAVKGAPDDKRKNEYYDLMMKDRVRVQDVILGLAAFTVKPESKQIEETLLQMLVRNHNRALEIEEKNVEITKDQIELNSPNVINIGENSFKDKINQVEKTTEFQQAKAKSSEIDEVGLLRLLADKFSKEELGVLCFKFNRNFSYDEEIEGRTREAKAMNLILYLDRRDQLNDFYEFMNQHLLSRDQR